jgi:phosphoglycerate dehydrogenase-like enzyme
LGLTRYTCAHAERSYPHRSPGSHARPLQGDAAGAVSQLTINVVGHHNQVTHTLAARIFCCAFAADGGPRVRDAPKLKWIQASDGVDNIIDLPSLGKEVLVTNIRGIHGAPVSEATIAYMLSLARDLPRATRAQDKSTWARWPAALLAGKTVGILGVGLIAEYLAPICKTFHMSVVGISGSPRATAF